MSANANYFKIGLFVITAAGLFCTGLILLGAGAFFYHSIPVETYFNESVQGLDVGSPVKYRGVQIGRVEKIDFVDEVFMQRDVEEPESFEQGRYIMVRLALEPKAIGGRSVAEFRPMLDLMVENGLRIRLTSQGLTGITYLETDYVSPEEYPPLDIDWVPTDALYVPSAPSVINRLSMYVEEVLKKLERTNIDKIGADAESLLETFTMIMEEDISPAFAELDEFVGRLEAILTSRQDSIEETLDNIRVVSENLKDITENAKSYPSQIILGEPPEKIDPKKW